MTARACKERLHVQRSRSFPSPTGLSFGHDPIGLHSSLDNIFRAELAFMLKVTGYPKPLISGCSGPASAERHSIFPCACFCLDSYERESGIQET